MTHSNFRSSTIHLFSLIQCLFQNVNTNCTMSKGWLELESDPGLFTLLIEDFGAHGVQVEEIYDLQKSIEGPVYGFIFLFRWIEERRSRRKVGQEEESFVMDDNVINEIFFAQQIIPNSCATHALLSVLLNCEKMKLGETLTKFKEFTKYMNPEDKGFAIGNMPDLAKAHNSHARPEPFSLPEKQQGISVRTKEAFHFVSYVPIGGRLFELDGLKPSPIDHGPWGEQEDWTEKFRRVISERLGMATGGEPYHDIRFNLMAVVPDRRQMYEQKLKRLKTNRQIVLEALQQMVNVTGSDSELSPVSRQAVKAGKAEQIITRSVSAKDGLPMELTPTQPLRSARLKQKAEAAAAALAAAKAADEEEDDHQEGAPGHGVDLERGNTDYKIVLDNRDDVLGLPTTVAQTSDVTGPLLINTKFAVVGSPGPASSSTETASEVASFLSSPTISAPNSAQCSPSVSPDKKGSPDIPVAKMELEEKLARARELQVQLEANGKGKTNSHVDLTRCDDEELMDTGEADDVLDCGKEDSEKKADGSPDNGRGKSKFGSHQGFTPKDLIELLKNVENEIRLCEDNLRDEVEKRKRYKIDDCRRTHNYDQYICTFLSMLAEQGHLAGLVEEHMLDKRKQGIHVGRLTKAASKPQERKKARTKKRR